MQDAEKRRLDELASIVGGRNVLSGDALSEYTHDYSPFPPVSPSVVVRPADVGEVMSVMRTANSARVPVVVRGGGASLTGLQDGGGRDFILLDMRRMNKVMDVDEINFTVRAECGVIMSDLEESAARKGLYVHTVTVPGKVTTLGGVLSGVVGGGLPVEGSAAGTDGRYVLGLRVVLPDGRMLSTGAGGSNARMTKDFLRGGNGPDLAGLFIGDGGFFGVKTDATLQLFPVPLCKTSGTCVFGSFKDAWNAFASLTSKHPLPFSRLSVLDGERFVLSYTCTAADEHELEAMEARIGEVCVESNAKEEYAAPPPGKDDFLRMTRGLLAFMAGKREFPETYGSVMGLVKKRLEEERLREKGVFVVSQFRPNMMNGVYASISIGYDKNVPEGRDAVLALMKDGYRLVVELGASPEPHQGFGSKAIGSAWSPEFRAVVMGIKALLDPNRILNPGLWETGQ